MKKRFYIIVQGGDDGELSTPSANAYRTKKEAIYTALDMIHDNIDLYCVDGREEEEVLRTAKNELEEDNCAYCSTEGGTDTFQICSIDIPVDDSEGVCLSDYDIAKQTFKQQGITQKRINSLYPKQFLESFLGFEAETKGYCLLCCMGHYHTGIPFDIAQFLSTGKVSWTDEHDNPVTMSFKVDKDKIHYHVSYRGVENDTTSDIDDVEDYTPIQLCKLQSEMIGEDCAEALDAIFPYDDYPFPEDIDDGSDV